MGSKKAPAAPGSPVTGEQITGAYNNSESNTQTAANNNYPQQAYDFYAPALMSMNPQTMIDYSNQWASQAPQMFNYANQAMQEGFDPQNAVYDRTATRFKNQMRDSQGDRGVQMSPHGAGLENQGMSDFNIDWEGQQLQRQNMAANTASQLWGQGGQALTGSQQIPQNIAGIAGSVQQLGMNAYAPQMWGAQQFGNLFGQGTAAQQGAYQNKLGQHKSDQEASNATWGGIGKLAGQLGSAAIMASDRRVKENVLKIADDPRGWGIYVFDYLTELETPGMQVGYMADEVEKIRPDAVHLHPSGIKMIDYSLLA